MRKTIAAVVTAAALVWAPVAQAATRLPVYCAIYPAWCR